MKAGTSREIPLGLPSNLPKAFRMPSLIVLVGFLTTFGIIRAITLMIRVGVGPLHNVSAGGLHIHHMVWGILILLAVGYIWLVPLASIETPIPKWVSCVTACVYGIGAALTLDEFALWLNFRDVYWERQGLESVDAAGLFVALVAISIWGGPFVGSLSTDLLRKLRARIHFFPMREPAA